MCVRLISAVDVRTSVAAYHPPDCWQDWYMMRDDFSQRPGTWRVADGSAVTFATAKQAWTLAARDVLIRTARRYHGYITYGELANEVQEITGIRTRSHMRNWIGAVLGRVADECLRRGESPLSALCVRQDETVGDGYAYVLEIAGEAIPDDLDMHAAEARLRCYRHFGAELPEDGGHPALTARVAAARRRRESKSEQPPAICGRCHLQLPASGRCDNCG